jgi:hypothetical protein
MKRFAHAFAGLLLLVGTSGCTSLAQFAATTATNMSSSTPAQATQAATLVTKAVDIAVNTGKLDRATLIELDALNEGVHAAWLNLKAANDSGHSLVFASFNAALDAFRAYATTKGVR